MRPLITFGLLASLLATWWAWHWLVRAFVTEFGVTAGLIALGLIYAAGLIIDRFDSRSALRRER
jgi:hypothetical protein